MIIYRINMNKYAPEQTLLEKYGNIKEQSEKFKKILEAA